MSDRIKTLIIALSATLFIAITASCTHNNGNIGYLFGKWKITSIVRGNTPVALPEGVDYYWNFQNTTVCMQTIGEYHQEQRDYGNFRHLDNTLYLDFSDERFAPPAALLLPRQSELQVLVLKRGDMTLTYYPTPDDPVTYTFVKW